MPPVLRVTSAVAYEGCPTQYFFREVRRVKTPISYPIKVGAAGHAALEVHNKYVLKHGRQPTFSKVKAVLNSRALKGGVKPRDIKVLHGLLFRYYELLGRSFLPTAVEKRHLLELDGSWVVTGKADLVTDEEVIDYKFSRVRRGKADVASDLQLGFYARLFRREGVRVVQLNPSNGSVTSIGAPALRWERVRARLEKVIEGLDAGSYPPNYDYKWCSPRLCGYWGLCRGNHKGR